ncbi:hypothetical protein M2162_004103 [Streptomyces sp. SAI-041]|nr:hypothetical protein [Streptomyces sp. SAI-041]
MGEGALVTGLLTVVADDRQAVALDAEDGQAVGAEARHGQARGHPQHLGGGAGLGQGSAGVQQEGLAGAPPVTGDRGASGGGAGGRLGDLLEGADELERLLVRVVRRLGAAAHGTDHPAPLVHDPDPDLGERVLGDRQSDDADDLVPVDRVQPGPGLGLGQRGPLGAQPEQPGGLRVDRDQFGGGVPVPQAGREGGEDFPHGGQGLTSAHCPTLRTQAPGVPLLAES